MRILAEDQAVLDHVAARGGEIVDRTVAWSSINSGSRNLDGLEAQLEALHIEAAREHGGHSYQSFVIDPGTGPRQQRLPAQGELGELLLTVGPRT